MDIIYAKSATKRRKQFQIYTRILQSKGEKQVEKCAIYNEGLAHIQNMFENIQLAERLYGDKATFGQLKNNVLISPFWEGISLGQKLQKCIREDDRQGIRKLLELWKSLIIGNTSNRCQFTYSAEFEAVFGSAETLIGDEAVAVANIDCSSENILFLSEQEIKIIDYEWFFSFPVPIDFIFYRMLKLYFENNRNLIDWDLLMKYADLSQVKHAIYDQLLSGFSEYVGFDKNSNIHYGRLGNQFLAANLGSNPLFPEDSYEFPNGLLPPKSKIVIYGAGHVGRSWYGQASKSENVHIVAWVDKKAAFYRKQGMNVTDCHTLQSLDFDYILISVLKKKVADEIMEELQGYGISKEKFIWQKPTKNRV